MNLSDFIVNYRNEHQMSQRQFALKCGVSNGYIAMLEKNVNPSTGEPIVPSLPSLEKISKAMGLSLDELFNAVDDMPINISPAIDTPAYSAEERRLVSAWRMATEKEKELVAFTLKDYGMIYAPKIKKAE